MIVFDRNQLVVKQMQIKMITSSSGGVITYKGEDGEYVKHPVSQTIARSFIKKHQVSQFYEDITCNVLWYGDHIICIERVIDGVNEMIPVNLRDLLDTIKNSEFLWYFDGTYIYTYNTENILDTIHNGEVVSELNPEFSVVPAVCYNLYQLSFDMYPEASTRYCVAYFVDDKFSISPPIWKNFDTVTSAAISLDQIGLPSDFDEYDEHFGVNLNFAIYAGKKLADIFGYEVIDPLMLPELMIELKTVNLDNLPVQFKQYFAIHMKFTDALAWLLGLSRRIETLEELIVVRHTIRHLAARSIFHRDSVKTESLVKNDEIPLIAYTPVRAAVS